MTEMILKNALIVGGVLVLFTLLRMGANRPANRDPATGDLILQCGPVLAWIMGTIAVGGPIGMGILSFIIPFQNQVQVFVPFVLGAFFLLLGGLMCLWALRRRTRVGERGLTSEYTFAQPKFLAWNEIERVDFSNGQEFYLIDGKRRSAMLHVWFVGVKEAIPLIRKHLPASVQEQYGSTIDHFEGMFGA